MHTHVLSPVNFANDIASNPRYNSLAGMIDMPLMRLQDLMKFDVGRKGIMPDGDAVAWGAKFCKVTPFSPYHLVNISYREHENDFPPYMYMLPQFNPRRFKFTPPPPFTIDLVAAVRR